MSGSRCIVRKLGRNAYAPIWQAMLQFTDRRHQARAQAETDACVSIPDDEIWWVEHDPVFTLGQAGKLEHILAPGLIPVQQSDRGGQVTYHGPGQLVVYPLVDLRRKKLGVREYVSALENATIAVLRQFAIDAYAKADAPGVYVGAEKIMALGIRVRHGCTLHGLALNVCMDLEPFARINPCGFVGLRHTSVYEQGGPADLDIMAQALLSTLAAELKLELSPESPELPYVIEGLSE